MTSGYRKVRSLVESADLITPELLTVSPVIAVPSARVTLTTRARLGRGTRSGGGTDESAFVEIAVADNGPGMSQKILENIFMPFFTTKDHGTGLGLAISQRIVEGAGGRIEVRSYEGKGSTFAVILPAAAPVLGTPSPAPVAAVALGEVRESAGSAASMSDAAVVSRSA